jgi:hypothetical protein
MRGVLRWINVGIGLACFASGAAALGSWVGDPGYRVHYGDAFLVLLTYVAFYGWVVRSFARDDAWVPRLAVAKALGAYLFLLVFAVTGRLWMIRTPGRYVYQLFEWGPGSETLLMGYVFLGRGVWNTVNAMVFTAPWWTRLRRTSPFLGRVVTAVPVAILVTLLVGYRELMRLEDETFSTEATSVAEQIAAGIDCDAIRDHTGRVTADIRERDERRYEVRIDWDCRDLQILVRAPDGRLGTVRQSRLECCERSTTPS